MLIIEKSLVNVVVTLFVGIEALVFGKADDTGTLRFSKEDFRCE